MAGKKKPARLKNEGPHEVSVGKIYVRGGYVVKCNHKACGTIGRGVDKDKDKAKAKAWQMANNHRKNKAKQQGWPGF